MSRYTMAQIVTLTGIKAHTLRKWEMRYSFLEPERTDTNIRFYSDLQLKKLLNIAVLTRNGYRISKIDKMSDDEIYETISSKLLDTNNEDDISALIVSMIEYDEESFDRIIKSIVIKKGLLATTIEIIYPFLNQVGILWGINKVMPAQEHFISNLIKKRIISAIDLLPFPKKDAASIVLFLTEGESHEIGLLLAYYIARELGWKVYYLGQNVPTENLKGVISDVNPNLLLTMFIAPTKESIESKIERILEQGNVNLLVSGNPFNFEDNIYKDRLIYLSNPKDFVDTLREFS